MAELTKKLHYQKTGSTDIEDITLYDSTDDCEEPYLSLQVDGANVYAKLGDSSDDNATALKIYKNSDKSTYSVLKEATFIPLEDDTDIDDNFIALVERTITTFEDDEAISIGSCTFSECNSLTSAAFLKATAIGRSAFGGCTSLSSINLPEATAIGGSAFYNCIDLTFINLPKVTSIDDCTFDNCTSLSSINLPEATTIGSRAFRNCGSLTSINLPKVTNIDYNAFYDCTSLIIHLAAENQSTIEALSGYSNKFGATEATIYFDL